MKAVKRNFLKAEEKIRFNKINHFQVKRYFNPSDFNLDEQLNIHFDYSEGFNTGHIRILAVYIDTSKSIESYEGIEFTEEFKVPFPKGAITNMNTQSISLKLKDDAKFLWKIGMQIQQQTDTLIHLSLS